MSKSKSDWLPIYIPRVLHGKLKSKAALEQKTLRDLCVTRLAPLVRSNGKGK